MSCPVDSACSPAQGWDPPAPSYGAAGSMRLTDLWVAVRPSPFRPFALSPVRPFALLPLIQSPIQLKCRANQRHVSESLGKIPKLFGGRP